MKTEASNKQSKGLILSAEICICNVEDYRAWVLHNIDALSYMFAVHLISDVFEGNVHTPDMNQFEDFCKETHATCIKVIAKHGASATRH